MSRRCAAGYNPSNRSEEDKSADKFFCAASLMSRKGAIVPQRNITRLVYIDAGANWGSTVRLWKTLAAKLRQSGYDVPASVMWEVYSFEAAPMIWPYLDALLAFFNGNGQRPTPPIHASGSSGATVRVFGRKYGCSNFSCIMTRASPKISSLLLNESAWAAFNSSKLLHRRLYGRTPRHTGQPHYTFIPAAIVGSRGQHISA